MMRGQPAKWLIVWKMSLAVCGVLAKRSVLREGTWYPTGCASPTI
jgi:hypothetical protein